MTASVSISNVTPHDFPKLEISVTSILGFYTRAKAGQHRLSRSCERRGLGCDQVHCVTKIPSLANHSLCGRVITDAYVLSEVSTKSTTLTVRNVPDVAQLN